MSDKKIDQHNGVSFYIEKNQDSIDPIYQYHDEANDLLNISKKLGVEFDNIIDSFCGCGHSLLPLIYHGIGRKGIGLDISKKSIKLAKKNSKLNGLENKCDFRISNIKTGTANPDGKNLFIANPPFALDSHHLAMMIENKDMRSLKLIRTRNGGTNGLTFTLEFIIQALKVKKANDVILGVTYSRANDNTIELEEMIQQIIKTRSINILEIGLVKNAKIWRGFNKKKEQRNPMNITKMTMKINPLHVRSKELMKSVIKFHQSQGWSKIGYYYFILK